MLKHEKECEERFSGKLFYETFANIEFEHLIPDLSGFDESLRKEIDAWVTGFFRSGFLNYDHIFIFTFRFRSINEATAHELATVTEKEGGGEALVARLSKTIHFLKFK